MMKIKPELMLPQKVTILNRLKKSDSATNTDVWYKTVLDDCVWNVISNSQQNGTQTNVGASISVQIPSTNKNYLPYTEWKQAGMQIGNWTVSMNDYIVLGEVTEDITASNIIQVMASYEPNACKIQLFDDLTVPEGSMSISNRFLEKYASIYYVEGV